MVRISSDDEFGSLLASVAKDTVTASIHWRLYNDLYKSIPDHVRELNESPAFWSLTINAHREVALYRLSRLYDQQSSALSLLTLLDTVAANRERFEADRLVDRISDNPFVDSLAKSARKPDVEALRSDTERVSKASDKLVKKLDGMRNRVLAHRDPRVVLQRVENPGDLLCFGSAET